MQVGPTVTSLMLLAEVLKDPGSHGVFGSQTLSDLPVQWLAPAPMSSEPHRCLVTRHLALLF